MILEFLTEGPSVELLAPAESAKLHGNHHELYDILDEFDFRKAVTCLPAYTPFCSLHGAVQSKASEALPDI